MNPSTRAAILATLDDAKSVFKAFTKANPKVQVYVPRQLDALVWNK